MIFVNIIVMIG